ncbi:MAG: tRNA (adenosine(37)-N6)-threonylcarbamoyltransferase complex dimerization subunit type 1 TsaB [Simkaniaceae bacterium]
MLSLIIDTSCDDYFLAIFHENTLLVQKKISTKTRQSHLIMTHIQSLFNECSLALNALTTIGVCVGPGSFTGTRIGVMVAKTLSFALHIPLVPFHSTEAYKPMKKTSQFGLIIDAKTDSYYFGLGSTLLSKDLSFDPPVLLKKEEVPSLPLITPQPHLIDCFDKMTPALYDAPRIAALVEKRFKIQGGLFHDKIQVLYLKNPANSKPVQESVLG